MTKQYWIQYDDITKWITLEEFLKRMDEIELNGTMPFQGLVLEKEDFE